jgi:hypothetical protein
MAVGITVLAGLSGCGHPPLSGTPAQAAVTPSAAPDAAAVDPYAFNDVPYPDYREAAQQLSIPTGLLVPSTGFTEALSTLCRSTPGDFSKLVNDQRSKAGSDSDGASTLQSLADEVQLRLSLSCPQRMTDWAAARADDQAYGDDATAPSSVSETGLPSTASPAPSFGSDDGDATSGTGDATPVATPNDLD